MHPADHLTRLVEFGPDHPDHFEAELTKPVLALLLPEENGAVAGLVLDRTVELDDHLGADEEVHAGQDGTADLDDRDLRPHRQSRRLQEQAGAGLPR